MQKLARNRKGLSTVITTLIILVVSVLLAGVVTYYATNVVMVRTIQEDVRIRKPHIWVEEGDNAYAALMVQNLGGRDILVDKLTVRGVVCPWGGESEVIATGAGIDPAPGSLSKTPIVPGSIIMTAIVNDAQVTITDTDLGGGTGDLANGGVTGTIDYGTGDWTLTFGAGAGPFPDTGTPITASYAVEGAVNVQYYRVESGQDVSGDFVLMEDAFGNVYAQIGTVPAQGEWASAPSDMPLKSSGSMLFFITNPTNIALNDVGTTISLTVYTTNAQWIVETIVQAAEIVPVA